MYSLKNLSKFNDKKLVVPFFHVPIKEPKKKGKTSGLYQDNTSDKENYKNDDLLRRNISVIIERKSLFYTKI